MKKMLNYLKELEMNNNREWYHTHKTEYKEANAEFEVLLQEFIFKLGVTDSSILHNNPKDLTFKLVRDTRFSHDKSPYNPAFRGHISARGKLPVPVGYYIVIKPENRSFLGGGLFADMFKDATTMVRDYLAEHPGEWEKIITADDFVNHFVVKGESLKKVPRGYDKEHPQAEYLKNKSWYLEYPITDEQLRDTEHFLNLAVSIFERMQPFNAFLNRALAKFEMPRR